MICKWLQVVQFGVWRPLGRGRLSLHLSMSHRTSRGTSVSPGVLAPEGLGTLQDGEDRHLKVGGSQALRDPRRCALLPVSPLSAG